MKMLTQVLLLVVVAAPFCVLAQQQGSSGSKCPKETPEIRCEGEGQHPYPKRCVCKNNCRTASIPCNNGKWNISDGFCSEGYERQYNSKHFVFFTPNAKKDLKLQCHYTTLTDGAATCNNGDIRVVKEPVCGKNCPKETNELTCIAEGNDGVFTSCKCKNNCNDFLVECSNGVWIYNATDCTDAANYSISSVDTTRPDGKIYYNVVNNGASNKLSLRCSFETVTEGTATCKNGITTIITKPVCGAKCRRETEDLICHANSEEVEGGTICTCKKNCKRGYMNCTSGAWDYNPDDCKASYSEYKPSIQTTVIFTPPQSYAVQCRDNPERTLQNGTATCINAKLTVVTQPSCLRAGGRQ